MKEGMIKMHDYILVYYKCGNKYGDRDINENYENKLLVYLEKEGFCCNAGFWGCPWFFVDIIEKRYKPGRPGVSYGGVLGDHAVTFGEFKRIYSIYKKYQGLNVLTMKRHRND